MIKDGVRYELHTLKFLLSVLGMSFALHDAKRAGAKCEPHPSMSNPSSLRQRLDHNIVAPPSISIATDQATDTLPGKSTLSGQTSTRFRIQPPLLPRR
jgi:hypothetical protein